MPVGLLQPAKSKSTGTRWAFAIGSERPPPPPSGGGGEWAFVLQQGPTAAQGAPPASRSDAGGGAKGPPPSKSSGGREKGPSTGKARTTSKPCGRWWRSRRFFQGDAGWEHAQAEMEDRLANMQLDDGGERVFPFTRCAYCPYIDMWRHMENNRNDDGDFTRTCWQFIMAREGLATEGEARWFIIQNAPSFARREKQWRTRRRKPS